MRGQRIDIDGWHVADVLAKRRSDGWGRRLSLFRTPADWTLLSVQMRASYDEMDHPFEGAARVRVVTYASLDELKADLVRDEPDDWPVLVMTGAQDGDPDLARLWAPLQIDRDLDDSSVHLAELRADALGRQQVDWRKNALNLAVSRLEQIGFVVVESCLDHRQVFPSGLGEWSNPIVGAVVALRRGYRVRLVVAIDDFGEVYTRTPDANLAPGDERRYPPEAMTDREHDVVADAERRRREARRR